VSPSSRLAVFVSVALGIWLGQHLYVAWRLWDTPLLAAPAAELITYTRAQPEVYYEDVDAEEMEITHVAAHRGQIKRGWIPRARGRATPSNHYRVNLEIFLEDFNATDDELEDDF